jgi:hypothetical protein
VLDGEPEQRAVEPGPTLVPLVTAASLAVALLGLIFDPLWVPVGALLVALSLATWTRPAPEEWDMDYVRAGETGALPTSWIAESRGLRPPILKGIIGMLIVLGVILATLLSGYFYTLAKAPVWPLDGLPARTPWLGVVCVTLAVAAAVALATARRRVRAGLRPFLPLTIAAALLVAVVGTLIVDMRRLDYSWSTNATGSVEWSLTVFMLILTLAVATAAAVVSSYARRGFFNSERFSGITAITWLGYFTAAAWVPAFFTVYVVPHFA